MIKFLKIAQQVIKFVIIATAVYTMYFQKGGAVSILIITFLVAVALLILNNYIFVRLIKKQEEKTKE